MVVGVWNGKRKKIMSNLEGKVAVITGGNSGIGLATAQRFVAEGAYVFITGRRQSELDEAVKQLGKSATAVRGDVSNLTDLDRLYATVKKQKGHIDILFANAGTGEFAPLGTIAEEHFDKIFSANVKGLLFTVQKALPLLKDGSSIILNASTTSVTGAPAFSVYSASKAAVRSFARTFTTDLKDRKIRVNAISPGVIPSPGYRSSLGMTEEQIKQYAGSVVSQIPLGRTGTLDEVAKVVSFLASDESSYVTGIELFVDGGMTQI
jgi:NAD(P)-dependent dehydrogenase (short-subunit alcohol dehydrogenase family)